MCVCVCRDAELAGVDHLKDEAAAAVSHAMLALEMKSNEIHEQRMSIDPSSALPDDDADSGAEAPLALRRASSKASSAADRSGESGNDSDFVPEEEDSSAEEGDGEARHGELPQGVARRKAAPSGERTTSQLNAAEELSSAVTRLLRKAGDVVSRSALTPGVLVGSGLPATRASELLLASGTILLPPAPYRFHPVYGPVWLDEASIERREAEDSRDVTQDL